MTMTKYNKKDDYTKIEWEFPGEVDKEMEHSHQCKNCHEFVDDIDFNHETGLCTCCMKDE